MDSRQDLPATTPDQEAEIAEEVRKEIKYHFGTEEGKLSGEDGAEEAPAEPEEAAVASGEAARTEKGMGDGNQN